MIEPLLFGVRSASRSSNPTLFRLSGPAGTMSGSGSALCILCEKGKFAETDGLSTCSSCSNIYGTEYTSSEGATSCDLCTKGYYMDTDGTCLSCDELIKDSHSTSAAVTYDADKTCPEGSTLASVRVQKQFYRFSDDR